MPPGSPFGPHTFKIGTAPHTILAMHIPSLAVPVNLFDMVALHRQAVPSLGTTSLKDPAPVLCFHPLTEAVYTHTATFLGLPRSLDHDLLIPPHKQQAAKRRRLT